MSANAVVEAEDLKGESTAVACNKTDEKMINKSIITDVEAEKAYDGAGDSNDDVGSDDDIGEPLQVVKLNEDEFELIDKALQSILLRDDVRDKPVVVISIAGAYRRGKSSMLNFFLRYLRSEDENWLAGDDCQHLTGFNWQGGKERVTTGIWMWSRPFFRNVDGIGEVAVLLMDTQGLYDRYSSVKDCATMFALSTLISSVQVFNLQNNLQMSDFEHLQLFGEYARMVVDGSKKTKPFQKLTLLVRDWQYPEDNDYGWNGGSKLLKTFFGEGLSKDMKNAWNTIRMSFSEIDCCLMPHPGKIVASSKSFAGELESFDEVFLECLEDFVPKLLDEDRLEVKLFAGNLVDGAHLFDLIQSYSAAFSGADLPEPKVVFACMVEATNVTAMTAAEKVYNTTMAEALQAGPLGVAQLSEVHENCKAGAIEHFNSAKKMGRPSQSAAFVKQLENAIVVKYMAIVAENRKNSEVLVKNLYLQAKNHYTSGLAKVLGDEFVNPQKLAEEHDRLCQEAFSIYKRANELGGDAELLVELFEERFSKAEAENKMKVTERALVKEQQSKVEAEKEAAFAKAEQQQAVSRASDLEAQHQDTRVKVASLEAQLNCLSIKQSACTSLSPTTDSSFALNLPTPAPTPRVSGITVTPASPKIGYPTRSACRYYETNIQVCEDSYTPKTGSASHQSFSSVNTSRLSDTGSVRSVASNRSSTSSSGRSGTKLHWVSGYTRKDGTVVEGYWRGRRSID